MGNLAVTAANVLNVNGTVRDGISGDTIVAGECVYLDAATDTIKKAIATSEAPAAAVGIALSDALSGQPIRFQFNLDITLGTGTEGVVYCVSATAGKIAPFADLVATNFVTILGVGRAGGSGIDMFLFASGSQAQ